MGLRDRLRNEVIRSRTEAADILIHVDELKSQWPGHV